MANNKKIDTQKLPFDKQIILNNFISSKFGYDNIDDLFALIKDDHKYDTMDADGHTKYYSKLYSLISNKYLLNKISEYESLYQILCKLFNFRIPSQIYLKQASSF